MDVPQSTNFPARTSYPFICYALPRYQGGRYSRSFYVSLRVSGPAGSGAQDLSGDVLERYAGRYPFQLNWKDRRPIGAIFLAGSQINVASNPRRWTVNASAEINDSPAMTRAKQLFGNGAIA